jgi:hypothetical protein
MSNRPALVTQADVARVIRACRRTGLTVMRVVVKPDGVEVETAEHGSVAVSPDRIEERAPVVL